MYKIIPLIACCLLFTGCNDVTEINIIPPEELQIEIAEVVEPEQPRCPEDWVVYDVPETDMSFCYDRVWGEPMIDKMESVMSSRGGLMSIRFAEEVFVDGSTNIPSLWFESVDHLPPDGDIGPHLCFHCMYGVDDPVRVSEFLYSEDEDVAVKSVLVDDKVAWYVHEMYTPKFSELEPYDIDRVEYLIPYAAGEYHLLVGVHTRYESMLEKFVTYILFDNNML